MINLLRMEFYKLWRHRGTKLLLLCLAVYDAYQFIYLPVSDTYNRQWQPKGCDAFSIFFSGSMLSLLAGGIYTASTLCSDFSQGTIGQQTAAGHKRRHILLAKAAAVSIASVLAIGINALLITLLLTAARGWGEPFTVDTTAYIVRVLLLGAVAFTASISIPVFFAFLCKDFGKTLVAFFAFMVWILEFMPRIGQKYTTFSVLAQFFTLWRAPSIFHRVASGSDIAAAVGACLASALVYMAAACWVFRKCELR